MTLIVGLGNPGEKYKFTRHNAGFLAADSAIDLLSAAAVKDLKGELFKSAAVLILKPLTFMNLSGESVLAAKNFYKPEKIIVIHDDIDIPFGSLRVKTGGSSGGHNGIKSIDAAIGAEYLRVRMGVSRPAAGKSAAEYVLAEWGAEEMEKIGGFARQAAKAAIALIDNPIEKVRAEIGAK